MKFAIIAATMLLPGCMHTMLIHSADDECNSTTVTKSQYRKCMDMKYKEAKDTLRSTISREYGK